MYDRIRINNTGKTAVPIYNSKFATSNTNQSIVKVRNKFHANGTVVLLGLDSKGSLAVLEET
jgi:hypothetical protein